MKSNIYLLKASILILILAFPFSSFAQSDYKMDFVNATWASPQESNDIVAVFHVSPLKKKFKRILSMRVTYSLDNTPETTVDITKLPKNYIRISIYGDDVEKKSNFVYNMIKDKMPDGIKEDDFLIVFLFQDIATRNTKDMSITYGLWEGKRGDKRVENKYNFKIETLK